MEQAREILRFTTAGSVDDGKSTLIGRLLYDSKSLYEDQLLEVKRASKRRGIEFTDLALVTDGLKAEREQGITIDVAYRYFNTPRRKFIIADTPGHQQYTRNMVTGASTANLALLLVDARNGIVEQTRRHALLASLLQIHHLVICINKMDAVFFDEAVFNSLKQEFEEFSKKLEIKDIQYIPISALHGDNVVNESVHMDWYKGSTLLYHLENVHISSDHNLIDCRFPVQHVIRPKSTPFADYRAYGGKVAGGIYKAGDDVIVLPSNLRTKIKKIELFKTEISEAMPPMSVNILLEDAVDISRGDMIVREHNRPQVISEIELMLCWLDSEKDLKMETKYLIRHTTREVRCKVSEIRYKMNINDLHRNLEDKSIGMNDIARVRIKCSKPLFIDSYRRNKVTGALTMIDPASNQTVGAGMII